MGTTLFHCFTPQRAGECYNTNRASVAQGTEHRSPKAGVVRSNRAGGTTVHETAPQNAAPFFIDLLTAPQTALASQTPQPHRIPSLPQCGSGVLENQRDRSSQAKGTLNLHVRAGAKIAADAIMHVFHRNATSGR